MVLFFARAGEVVRVHVGVDPDSRDYVIDIQWPNRAPHTERFQDRPAFAGRLAELEQQFDSWSHGDPQPLPNVPRTGHNAPAFSTLTATRDRDV